MYASVIRQFLQFHLCIRAECDFNGTANGILQRVQIEDGVFHREGEHTRSNKEIRVYD